MTDAQRLPNLIILGPQGSGKGTQAERLAKHFGYTIIGMGQLFRDRIARGDAFGRKLAAIIHPGNLVGDADLEVVLDGRLAQLTPADQVIFEGVPRTHEQVAMFEHLLAQYRLSAPLVIVLKIPRSVSLERIANRMRCQNCGAPVGLISRLIQRVVCSKCGRPFNLRADDRAEAIEVRLNLYHTQTIPVIDHYRQLGRVIEIDGSGTIEDVYGLIVKALRLEV